MTMLYSNPKGEDIKVWYHIVNINKKLTADELYGLFQLRQQNIVQHTISMCLKTFDSYVNKSVPYTFSEIS